MKKVSLLVVALLLCSVSVVYAKRSPPTEIAPLRAGDIELRVPHDQMGCVEAWAKGENRLVWRRQIYVVKYNPSLERDVQDVFIQSVELAGKTLTVKNERQSVYQLDLGTLEVKVVKGSLVEGDK